MSWEYAVEGEAVSDELTMLQSLLPPQGGSAVDTIERFEASDGDGRVEAFIKDNAQYFPEMGETNVLEALHQVHHLIEHYNEADKEDRKAYAKEAALVLVKRVIPILKQAVANKTVAKDHSGVPKKLTEQFAGSAEQADRASPQKQFWMKRAYERAERLLYKQSRSRSTSQLRLRGGTGEEDQKQPEAQHKQSYASSFAAAWDEADKAAGYGDGVEEKAPEVPEEKPEKKKQNADLMQRELQLAKWEYGVFLGADIKDDNDRRQRLYNRYNKMLQPKETGKAFMSFLRSAAKPEQNLQSTLPAGTAGSQYGRGSTAQTTWGDLLISKIRGKRLRRVALGELSKVTEKQWRLFIGRAIPGATLTTVPDPKKTHLYDFLHAWYTAQTEGEQEAVVNAHQKVFELYQYMPQEEARSKYLTQEFKGLANQRALSVASIYKVLGTQRDAKFPDAWWQKDSNKAYTEITGKSNQEKPSRRPQIWWEVLKSLGRDPATAGLSIDDVNQNPASKRKLFDMFYAEMGRWTKAAGGNLGLSMEQYQLSERKGGYARVLSRETEASGQIRQMSGEREVASQQKQLARDRPRKRRPTEADDSTTEDVLHLRPYDFVGAGNDYGAGGPGLGEHYKEWWEILVNGEIRRQGGQTSERDIESIKYENSYKHELFRLYKKFRDSHIPVFELQNTLLHGKGRDREQLAAIVEQYAWNQYANAQVSKKSSESWGVFQGAATQEDFFYNQIFDPDDKATIERILPKFLGARAYNRMEKGLRRFEISADDVDAKAFANSYTFYNLNEKRIELEFTRQEKKGEVMPEEWRKRLKANQSEELFNWYFYPPKKRPKGRKYKQWEVPSQPKTPLAMPKPPGNAPRPFIIPAPLPVNLPPIPKQSPDLDLIEPSDVERSSRSRSRISDVYSEAGRSDATLVPKDSAAFGISPQGSEPSEGSAPGLVGRRAELRRLKQEIASGTSSGMGTSQFHARMHGFQARQTHVQEMRRVAKIRRQHRHNLIADVYNAESGYVTQRHLLQTDNNVQPIMGAVHLVQMAPNAHEKHFMFDIGGDVNMGQKQLTQNAKSGPFANKGGRSLVLDNSAHIKYRNRHGVFEITVTRGVTQHELDVLLSKLSMHRISTAGTTVRLLKGRKGNRAYYGRLADIDLRALISAVEDCLLGYRTCGLELVEPSAGSGAIYKAPVHGKRFKARVRQKAGPFQKR